MQKIQKYFGPLTILWGLFIALAILLPGDELPRFVHRLAHLDKIIHGALFAILSFLMCIALWKKIKKNSLGVVTILGATTYGVVLEITQSIIPKRSLDINDIIANFAGVLLGYLFFLCI